MFELTKSLPQSNISKMDVVTLLRQLVSIPSVNPSLDPYSSGEKDWVGEKVIATFIADYLQGEGLEVHLEEVVPNRPNVIAIARGSGGGKSLMLNAHMDTVGVTGMYAPFEARVENDKLLGRGSLDMKAGLAAAITATVQAKNMNLKGDVLLTAVIDEEHSSLGTEAVMQRYKADAAIVTEPSWMNLCLAHRGFAVFEIEVQGKAVHTSQQHLGVNAVMQAGKILAEIAAFDKVLQHKEKHPWLGVGSLQATLIQGGQELFTSPALCKLSVERRTLPHETKESVEYDMQELLRGLEAADPTFKASCKTLLYREAHEVAQDETIVQLAKKYLPDADFIGAPYWMDSALIGAKGIPALVLGPGGGGMHQSEEWVSLGDVRQLVNVLESIIQEFCN
jgi:acetylornithine deacetylase